MVALPAKNVLIYCWFVMLAASDARCVDVNGCVAGFWKLKAQLVLNTLSSGERYCVNEAGSAWDRMDVV